MTRLLAVAYLALASCSGGHTAPSHPEPHGSAALQTPADGPNDPECDALILHAVALGMIDQRAAKPPDRLPTDEQQTAMKAELRAKFGPSCRAMSRSRYECAVDAPTSAALERCDQASLSSSTSNSSVAPPGITPPAPRSP